MARRKRIVRKKSRNLRGKCPTGYDSWFEYDLHKTVLKGWEHHGCKFEYTETHRYEPDFTRTTSEGTILVESKGRFRDRREATKYLHIRSSLPKDTELIFLFQDSGTSFPHAKRRKDGTKMTHGEWATLNKFRYYCCRGGVPDEFSQTFR